MNIEVGMRVCIALPRPCCGQTSAAGMVFVVQDLATGREVWRRCRPDEPDGMVVCANCGVDGSKVVFACAGRPDAWVDARRLIPVQDPDATAAQLRARKILERLR